MSWLTATLAAFIVVVLVARAAHILRTEARAEDGGRPRGVAPGKGYTHIQSDYSSGLGGGSQLVTRVPRDPDEYARAFVPRGRDRQTSPPAGGDNRVPPAGGQDRRETDG